MRSARDTTAEVVANAVIRADRTIDIRVESGFRIFQNAGNAIHKTIAAEHGNMAFGAFFTFREESGTGRFSWCASDIRAAIRRAGGCNQTETRRTGIFFVWLYDVYAGFHNMADRTIQAVREHHGTGWAEAKGSSRIRLWGTLRFGCFRFRRHNLRPSRVDWHSSHQQTHQNQKWNDGKETHPATH